MVIEPFQASVERGERGRGADGTADVVAKTIGFDLFGNFGEAVCIDFWDDLSAVDFNGRGGNGKTLSLFVVHVLDDVLRATVLGEFTGFPSEGSGGFLIATVVCETFCGTSLNVITVVVVESAVRDFCDFDDLCVVDAELD